jgi:hypothetical protein
MLFNSEFQLVILCEAKDLLSRSAAKKQILRFAQDDKFIKECERPLATGRALAPQLPQESPAGLLAA